MKYNKSDSVSDILDSLREQKKQREEQAHRDIGHILSISEDLAPMQSTYEPEAVAPPHSYTRFIVILILTALTIGGIFFYIGTKGGNRDQAETASSVTKISSSSSTEEEAKPTASASSSQSEVQRTTSETQTETTATESQTTKAQTVVTSPETSQSEVKNVSLSDKELGFMYNLFHLALIELPGDMSELGGWITDYNGDGIDDMVIQYLNIYTRVYEYIIYQYKNGALQKLSNQTVDISRLNPVQYYNSAALSSVTLSFAHNYGYGVNSPGVEYSCFEYEAIGYVKTNGVDSHLNLRSSPSTSSDVIVKLPNRLLFGVKEFYDSSGYYVEPWAENASWLKIYVIYNSTVYEGYVSKDYVEIWIAGI